MIGQRLLHYQITEKLGEGGMGVVYKARDSHLDRFVAIKVLPPEKVADPERKRRFVQEAKAASALNHPNIITIHDITQEAGIDFIVMEYVAGKPLDQVIGRKGLKLNEALKCAIQIADALARAHAASIVHRDLKPSNVMVDEHGLVKVLDFGLAKLMETAAGEDEATRTLKPRTEAGTIVGTVAYMSPEQAEGRPVDARSDIFSFGALLYEMVTGRRAFQGSSKLSTLSAVLHQEPKPPEGAPPELEKVIARCLRKDPARRIQHIDDVRLALEELKEESESGKLAAAPSARARHAWPLRLVVPVALLASALAWYYFRQVEKPEAPLKVVPLTSYPGLESEPSLSPDGNEVAFVWNGEEGGRNFDIYRKLIGPGKPLRLTTDPAADFSPAWSPDGRWIAFLRSVEGPRSGVYLIPALGGPERLVGEVTVERKTWFPKRFLDWSPDGKWLAVCDHPSICLLSVESGEKRKLTSPPAQSDEDPAFSPDGRALAFVRNVALLVSHLYVLELGEDLTPKGEPKRLTGENRETAHPVWTADGREIVFVSGHWGSLNLWRMAVRGPGKPRQLTSSEELASFPTISRRGNRLVFTRLAWDSDIWRIEAPGPNRKAGAPKRLISSTRDDWTPQYSPDGKRIALSSVRSGSSEVWVCDSEGVNCAQLTSSGGTQGGTPRWSPDGGQIVFDSRVSGQAEIYVISAHGGAPRNLTNHPAQDEVPSWSRDGRWIYFASDRSGRSEVWKAPANGGQAVQVTRQGGFAAFESADGRSLYYSRDPGLWKVPVEGGEETRVLESLANWGVFAVTAEGIYFIPRPDARGKYSICFFSFATGRTTQVAGLEKTPEAGLSVSPDGRYLIYSQVDRWESDLMLVENFR